MRNLNRNVFRFFLFGCAISALVSCAGPNVSSRTVEAPSQTAAERGSSSPATATVPAPSPTPTTEPTPFRFTQLTFSYSGNLHGMAFSPDGERLAAGFGDGYGFTETDGAVIVWDVKDMVSSGVVRSQSLSVPSVEWITSVAFSADGLFLGAGSWSGDVLFWDAASIGDGAQPIRIIPFAETGLHIWEGHPEDSIVAASSQEGILAAAYGPYDDDGGVILWDFQTGKRIRTIPARAVYDLAFSPDGKLLAVGSSGGQLALWSVANAAGIRDYEMQKMELAGINKVAFSPDGKTLAAALINGKIYLLNTYHREVLWVFDCGEYTPGVVSFSPDGRQIAVGIGKNILFLDRNGGRTYKFEAHKEAIQSLAYSPDGTILASADRGGTITLWNVADLLSQQ
jgi:WD40 repeat protein